MNMFCVYFLCVSYCMSRMTGLLEAKILATVATVLLETEAHSKSFSSVDSCFSYQVSQNEP
jgi:hypothetical protein